MKFTRRTFVGRGLVVVATGLLAACAKGFRVVAPSASTESDLARADVGRADQCVAG